MQAWRTFRPIYNADTCLAPVLPELFYIKKVNELMAGVSVSAHEYLVKIASRVRKQKEVSPASQLSFIIMPPTCKRLVLTFVG